MNKKILICDLDNTLYDWVGYFVPSLYAMVDKAVERTGWNREELLTDLKFVHQKNHDSEHPFALLETRLAIQEFEEAGQVTTEKVLDEALHAFNSERKARLKCYPGVHETLSRLCEANVVLIAHSEAKLHAVVDRMRRLDLIRYFERIFCRERPLINHPNGKSFGDWLEGFPLKKITELSHHKRKPNPSVLFDICETMNVTLEDAAYVGDSISHDISMANRAGIYSIHAKYGTRRDPEIWDKLVRISHWTDEDVAREAKLGQAAWATRADYVAEQSFCEVLDALNANNKH